MDRMMNLLQTKLTFILALICILGGFALAFVKGLDTTVFLSTIFGAYITGRSAQKISATWAASKDPDADTAAVIDSLEGHVTTTTKQTSSSVSVDVLASISK